MKRKTPGQVAREAFYHDLPTEKWNASPRWEAAATAVLADQWMVPPPLPQPPVDPYESLKKAHAAGKVIQHEYKGSPGTWFDCVIAPQWLQSMNYRVKPWSLSRHLPGFRPLEDGEDWHRQDFTEDILPEGYRPLLKGELTERGDQGIYTQGQTRLVDILITVGKTQEHHARTTRPLPPTKEELEIEAFYAWWADYKLTAIDRTPNRETAYAAWKASRSTNANHEKA